MPWVEPRTWVTDEFVTAAMINTSWRDNIGSSFREVELLTPGASGSAAVWTTQNGVAVATFTARTFPGYPCEIRFQCPRVSSTGPWWYLGVVDGTGTALVWTYHLGYGFTDWSGEWGTVFTPTPGTHTYTIRMWTNTGTASWDAGTARLLEKAGPA